MEFTYRFEMNKNFIGKWNRNMKEVQKYLDNKVVMELQKYVSKKTGAQEKSIRTSTNAGSGLVCIGVPYAHYQAYSHRIHKLKGIRGPRPFERMKADKRESILNQTAAYSRRLNG